jgi:hypothetical protein
MKKNSEQDSEKLLRRKVEGITDLSEVLAGKKPVGGKIGEKLKKQKDLEKDLKQGKALRDKKFKKFDEWCNRIEGINNNHEEETKCDSLLSESR